MSTCSFVNPGDLRVAAETCGANGCHASEVLKVKTSMMTHGGMLWGAALYNNGSFPLKNTHFGESYSADGTAADNSHDSSADAGGNARRRALLPELTPLERWEISQPGNVLRVFERGGMKKGEIGNPDREEESGRPDDKLGERGFGTLLRTDPVFLGLQKTRLARSAALASRHKRPARRLSRQRLHCLPRCLRQRSLPGALGAVREVRTSGRKRFFRSHDSEE